MTEINNRLFELYNREIKNLSEKKSLPENIDGPNLMYCWEDDYLNSEYKILFLGRESNGWLGYLNLEVEECINKYKDFEFCEKGNFTTFWQYIYDTKNILMPDTIGQKNFLWSNVSKFSKADEGTAIDLDDFKYLADNFNVIENEIKITKPDVIIFFTGHSWDFKIQYQIKDRIEFQSLSDQIEISELARLKSNFFPYHTYRVDHPITLQVQKKWNYMELIMDKIKSTTHNNV